MTKEETTKENRRRAGLENLKKAWASEKTKRAQRENIKKSWNSPKHKKAVKENLKKAWAANNKKKHIKRYYSEERKAKLREYAKKGREVQAKKRSVDRIYKSFGSNPLLWGMYYCEEHFREESPGFHLKILKESIGNRKLAVAAPRESAKSTILTFLKPTHGIVFKKYHFIVIIQNTFNKAAGSLEAIKEALKYNDKIKRDFMIDVERDTIGDTIFRHKDGFRVRVLCKGAEQMGSVRGEKFGAWRPDLIILDDLEDDELVRNPDRRRRVKDEFNEAILPAEQEGEGQFIAVGTILHDDSLMAELVSRDFYKDWRKLFFQIKWKDSKGEWRSLWEDKWSMDRINELERENPTAFAKERMNNPVSGENREFNREDFRYWRLEGGMAVLFGEGREVRDRYDLKDCVPAIGVDLAWEERRDNDDSVLMGCLLTPGSDLLVEGYIKRRGLRPHRLAELLFDMEGKLYDLTGRRSYVGFEKAKLEKMMKYFLKQEMRRRGQWLIIKDVPWEKEKQQRIVSRLEPRYANHAVFHKSGMGDLEHQLLRVPYGTRDDLADALQMASWLLREGKKRSKKKCVTDDDPMFNKLRDKVIKSKRPRLSLKDQFVTRRKNGISIPAEKSLW